MANVPNIPNAPKPEHRPQAETPDTELDEMAFRIFTQRAAAPVRRIAETDAAESYRLAKAFLSVRARQRAGEPEPEPIGPRLADCCCPNQPRNHPHNLVAALFTDRRSGAQAVGDVNKVRKINEWLQHNPTPADNPGELVSRINYEFPELAWGLAEINTARAIFPFHARQSVSA